MYKSTKIFDGFSTCFRQHLAEQTHCKYLHGYALKFRVTFAAEKLDEHNWVQDFGFAKRSKELINGHTVKDWFSFMFDHTTIIAEKDPHLETFKQLDTDAIIQLRILPEVGCEIFARYVFFTLDQQVKAESGGRVWIECVECFENNKNSALYERQKV